MKRQSDITLDVCDKHVIETIAAGLKATLVKHPNGTDTECASTHLQQRSILRRRSAFTLVELLVVVAIIGLLTSILLPSLAKAKDLAYSVKCLAHLRGLGQACHMYALDNGGRLPSATDAEDAAFGIRMALEPFVGTEEMFLCSRDTDNPTLPEGSYDWRFTDDSECSLAGTALYSISQPASLILGGDRQPSWHNQDWINVVFADTHAKSVTEDAWFANLSLPVR